MTQLEASTLGTIVRQRRTEMNLTLKEVETATSIRMNYLQAIENDQAQRSIPPVYAQGFVRQYAIFLGLDADQLLRDHTDLFQKGPDQEFNYGIGTLEMRNSPGAAVKGIPNFAWGIILFIVLLAAWYFATLFEVI